MEATDILMSEHRVIERVITTLEKGAHSFEAGGSVGPSFFLDAADFIKGFADGCHHQKEEGVLFKRMEEQGMQYDGCPLGVMMGEHALARQYTKALLSAAQAMQAGEPNGNARAIQSSRSYIALLRRHIMKEDNILFPMADHVIPPELHAAPWEDFEHIEHIETGEGVHEKYLALAETLEREMAM